MIFVSQDSGWKQIVASFRNISYLSSLVLNIYWEQFVYLLKLNNNFPADIGLEMESFLHYFILRYTLWRYTTGSSRVQNTWTPFSFCLNAVFIFIPLLAVRVRSPTTWLDLTWLDLLTVRCKFDGVGVSPERVSSLIFTLTLFPSYLNTISILP